MMKVIKGILIPLVFVTPLIIWGENQDSQPVTQAKDSAQMISFHYDNEDLVNVINYVASKKGINLLLPTKADDKITGKLSWHLDKKVTIEEGWNLLGTILDIAGYSIVPKEYYYEIVKNNMVKTSQDTSPQPMPLYVGVSPDELPATDQRIRYLYYLANIKTEAEGEKEIGDVLKALLPPDAVYRIDPAANALIIMAKSNDVRSLMAIITQLDRPGFQEAIEIIKLKYTEAQQIATLFNKNILQERNEPNRYRLDTQKKSDISYFSKHLKIIAQERTNSLIVLGRAQSVTRIKEFIHRYIDVEQGSGKSIIHVYHLQYRNAPQFAKVLENIVQSKRAEGFEQATGDKKAGAGPQRYFEEVLISVDTPPEEEQDFESAPTGDIGEGETPSIAIKPAKYYGGNKLIIAARSDDWKRLKALIEQLDQPEPQVLIEVLIADLTLDDARQLGSMFRNPEKLPMPGETNFQAAHLNPGVMADQQVNPNTIGVIKNADGSTQYASDLLRLGLDTDGKRTDDPAKAVASIADSLTAGSTVLSFNDSNGKTWGIAQILKVIDNTKILSHPHVISTNNQEAKIEITETRLLKDQASGSQGGTLIATNKNIPASLKVKIIPRISISEVRENTVNLQVLIDINEYAAAASTGDNTRITRNVTTNATVVTGDILALGGLVRTNEVDEVRETPILGKIPIIGWLFKKRFKTKNRTNLTVFISPTIIEPRIRSGIGEYTQDYLNLTKEYAKSGDLFDSLKDPITRWFFGGESTTEAFTTDFMKPDIHNESRTPMPQKNSGGKARRLAQADQKEQPNIIMEQQKEQVDQLKNLFQDIENPFAHVKKPTAAA